VPDAARLSLRRLTQDVIELADHLGCERFHLAGSSAGAIVSMQTTLDFPSRVKTLGNFASTPGLKNSLVDPAQWMAKIRAKGLRGFLEETIHDRFPRDADPGFLKWFIDEASRNDVEYLFRFVPLMKEVDQTDRLHEIRCPMLAVIPGHDPLGTPEQYAVIKQRVPHCDYRVLAGLPHNITDAVPELCAETLLRFLLPHRAG
jgi:pimeloyl-ACP methyl ester carboxylesterase